MTIQELYEKISVPQDLQKHMLRVCGVISFVEKYWTGEPVDWLLAKKTALLHDIGNIIKFDFDNHPELLGTMRGNIEHWKQVQQQMRETYGTDEHQATKKILEEAGATKTLINTVLAKSFSNSIAVAQSNDWNLKLLYYGDFRTLPSGVGTLEERLNDIRNRMPHYTNRADFEDLVAACRQVEVQVQKNINIPVSQITESSIRLDPALLELSLEH